MPILSSYLQYKYLNPKVAMKPHRLLRNKSILFVCDIQDKFVPRVYGKQGIVQAASMMVRAAKILGITIIVTEQTRKVMGQTVPQVKKWLKQEDFCIEKTKFSMVVPQIEELLTKHKDRTQVILIGMETQVCILQTCLDLIQKNYEVFLPVDAITSIRSWERKVALRRMNKQGAILTTFQSAVFDLLKDAKDQKFKQILTIIKQSKRQLAISHL